MKANTGEIKRVRKTFTVMSYEKEEQFLTEMAAKGWRFVDTNGWVYTFERCEPEQVVYRLDYSGLALNERSDYYAMFRDYGWEYLQDFNGFSYFRKPAAGATKEDLEIFSDGASHLEMAKKVLTATLLPFLLLEIYTAFICFRRIRKLLAADVLSGWDWLSLVGCIAIAALIIFVFGREFYRYFRLKKKYLANE